MYNLLNERKKSIGYKTTDALMRHLRDSGITIKGGKQK